jgi:parvulin-like peptidyl-prolyl isomerase
MLNLLKYTAYSSAYEKSLTYSDSDIQATYDENPRLYDAVSYETALLVGVAETTTDDEGNVVEPTEEESAAAVAKAKETAEKILADYLAGGDLETLAEANGATYSAADSAPYSGSVLTEWLFDDARKVGDTTILENGSAFYVTVFHDRFLNDYETIDVRHVLIQPEVATLTAADEGYQAEVEALDAAAKARAEELHAQWKAGEATEESFAALAMAESSDSSKYVGGLYSQVPQNQMVATFNDWCFDESRESGDTDIVESDYGYHIMYFVGKNLPYWKTLVVNDLKSADYLAWEGALSAESNIQHGFGMKFVG